MTLDAALPNSMHARDIAHQVHPQTNLATHLERGPTIIVGGKGASIRDDTGKEYLEAAGGLWAASLGFANERLAKVAYDQMCRLGYYPSFRHRATEPSIDLAEKLLSIAPLPMSKVLFQGSGSEAIDTAIKLCWYFNNAIGRPAKRKIIGRHMGYHGNTIAAASLTGKPDMHTDFNLPLDGFLHTDFPNHYRFAHDGESEEEFSTRMADSLETLIQDEGPDTVAAFVAEPVMGGGGAVLPPKGYFEKIQKVLRRYDVLFVADEVICGFGRTGNMWGSQTYDLRPDMIACAKALSAAMQPISALIVNQRVFDAMVSESRKLGIFSHGYTYAGHPVASAVALEVLNIYEEMDIVGQVRSVMPAFQRALRPIADHPLIGYQGDVGLMCGFEIVEDKVNRKPFDAARKVGARVGAVAEENGLLLRVVGDRIAVAPPLIITEEEIAMVGERLLHALDRVHGEIGA